MHFSKRVSYSKCLYLGGIGIGTIEYNIKVHHQVAHVEQADSQKQNTALNNSAIELNGIIKHVYALHWYP